MKKILTEDNGYEKTFDMIPVCVHVHLQYNAVFVRSYKDFYLQGIFFVMTDVWN